MTRQLVAIALAGGVLAAFGCGDEQTKSATTPAATVPDSFGPPPQSVRACRVLRDADVKRFLERVGHAPPRTFEQERRESEGLSDCRYFEGDDVGIWLTIDTAVQAQKRYWYRKEEQQQFHSSDEARRPLGVRGVGQDRTYGGVGAFWTPAINRLLAYRDDTMLLVGFRVAGISDATAREAAADVARLAYRRMFGNRPPAAPRSLAKRPPHP